MIIRPTSLSGCLLFEPKRYYDNRGFFQELFRQSDYAAAGITQPLVQDNWSHSAKNVLRGMHFQRNAPQGKLVSVLRGEIFDVAVDIRPGSASFGQWQGVILSEQNGHQLWLPPGFAHGFLVLSEQADVLYKTSDYYDSSDEGSFNSFSPALNIHWPTTEVVRSVKDAAAPDFTAIFP